MMKDIDVAILEFVERCKDGTTTKDVNEYLDGKNIVRGRNTVSATLNVLHRDGLVFYLSEKSGKFRVYLHSKYRQNFLAKDRHDKPLPQTNWERAARLWREIAESDTVTPELWREAIKEFERAENDG